MSLGGRFCNRFRVVNRVLRTRTSCGINISVQTRNLFNLQNQSTNVLSNKFNHSLSCSPLVQQSIRSFSETVKTTETETAPENASEDEAPEAEEKESHQESSNNDAVVAQLQARIEELEKQSADFKNAALEYKAEIYNVRTRSQKEVENAKKFSIEKFAKEMLTIADNVDLALKNVEKPGPEEQNKSFVTLYEGMEMTAKTTQQVFGKFDIVKAESMGVKFSVNMHEVLFQIPKSDPSQESGTIVNVVRDGYWLKERALRSAQVGVCQ